MTRSIMNRSTSSRFFPPEQQADLNGRRILLVLTSLLQRKTRGKQADGVEHGFIRADDAGVRGGKKEEKGKRIRGT